MDIPRKAVRPKAHIAPRVNTSYQLSGIAYSRGLYRAFFEFFPFRLERSDRRYIAFVSSEDLMQWKDESCAVYPTIAEDADGARAGSIRQLANGDLELIYIGLRSEGHTARDLNIFPASAPLHTSILAVTSHQQSGRTVFDNVNSKRVLITEQSLIAAGLVPESIRDPEFYGVGPEEYLTVLGTDDRAAPQLCLFKKVEGRFSFQTRFALPFKSPVLTLRFLRIDGLDCALIETASKIVGCRGNLDFKAGSLALDTKNQQILDYGMDSSSPRIAYDTRNLPYLMTALEMEHDIKGARGMISLPKRLTADRSGIALELHPLIENRLIFTEDEPKIKQTHLPQLLKVTLRDGDYVTIGNLAIYLSDSTLHVDRRKALSNLERFRTMVNAALPVKGDTCPVSALIDQDCIEIFHAGRCVSYILADNNPQIATSAGVKGLKLFTLNHIK
mgnify:CR=1 FL=1